MAELHKSLKNVKFVNEISLQKHFNSKKTSQFMFYCYVRGTQAIRIVFVIFGKVKIIQEESKRPSYFCTGVSL